MIDLAPADPPIADRSAVWSPAERAAWRPPVRVVPSEWAERNRLLGRGQSARTGPWRNVNAPYGVGIMDACTLPGVEEITIQKAAQIGVSEFVRNVLGCFAENDPDPAIIVLPNKEKGEEIVSERLIPLFRDTPCLAALATAYSRDQKLTMIRLNNGFVLWLGYSGSPTSLGSHPVRIVVNDEVNKFVVWSGAEADPVSLAEQRTKTFDNRIIYNISTPTTRDGMITVRLEMADVVLFFWVPCPRCGRRIQLSWSCVRWSKFADERPANAHELARLVEHNKAAWYECPECGETFTEDEKPEAVRRGFWATEQQVAERLYGNEDVPLGGIVRTGLPRGRHVAMQIGSLVCMWVKCYRLAAKFLRVKDTPALLMDFINSDLGEVFEQRTASTKQSFFSEKCQVPFKPGELPPWTARLLATVDVQEDHFYVLIRAWGAGLRSRRIWHTKVAAPKLDPRGWEELRRILFATPFPFAGAVHAPMVCDLAGVDCGYRTDEVYQFALTDQRRIKPLKGSNKPLVRCAEPKKHTYTPPDRRRSPYTIWYHLVDASRCKDWLLLDAVTAKITRVNRQTQEVTTHDLWELNCEDDPVYNRHLASQHKVLERKGHAQPVEVWKPRGIGDAHNDHYLDCEANQRALAFIGQLELLDESFEERRARDRAWREAVADDPGVTTPDGRAFLLTDR